MRTKDDILTITMENTGRASGPKDISLIHELHTLEVLIDIRDVLKKRLDDINNTIRDVNFRD